MVGNARKLAGMRKIRSWFKNKEEMKMEVQAIVDSTTEEEDMRLFLIDDVPKHMMEIVLWAMDEADDTSPMYL